MYVKTESVYRLRFVIFLMKYNRKDIRQAFLITVILGSFLMPIFSNLFALFIMFQIIIYFFDQVALIFIVDEIFIRNKVIQHICLIIREKKTTGCHNVHTAKRNAGFYAS